MSKLVEDLYSISDYASKNNQTWTRQNHILLNKALQKLLKFERQGREKKLMDKMAATAAEGRTTESKTE